MFRNILGKMALALTKEGRKAKEEAVDLIKQGYKTEIRYANLLTTDYITKQRNVKKLLELINIERNLMVAHQKEIANEEADTLNLAKNLALSWQGYGMTERGTRAVFSETQKLRFKKASEFTDVINILRTDKAIMENLKKQKELIEVILSGLNLQISQLGSEVNLQAKLKRRTFNI